ncbi:cytochrome c [Sporosarcina sp. ACRSL]|uniref:c-type cytochrome n=1 Tax=Sporosarcina sp. ACRSL TaxID=2918215 RepID=UPI001EF71E05|nr:cytochrome c [Sporosarcina sp. ACRSL]MCG7345112.1 cytochrome c [Sporosarcina sp. ACRSL]
MKNNPVVPYILIFALGLGLIFFMSLYGIEQKNEIAGADEEGKTEETTDGAAAEDFDPDAFAHGQCIACHGGDLTGSPMAPSLVGTSLSQDELHDIIKNGKGATMPAFGGKISDDQIDQLSEYILSLK